MTCLYDFAAYRANRLLGGVSRRAEQVSEDIGDWQNHMSKVDLNLDKCTEKLRDFRGELQAFKTVCRQSQILNENCQAAIDEDNLDELIKLRDQIKESRGGGR